MIDSIFGSYHFTEPNFTVTDPAAIRQITVTDYAHFIDHRPFVRDAERTEPIFGKCLFMLNGDRWRDMRTTLTPAFTSSKLRRMLPLVAECCEQYAADLHEDIAGRQSLDVEAKDLMKRYLIDVIASTAFGYRINSWRQRSNRVYTTARDTMHFHTGWNLVKMTLVGVWPRLCDWLGLRLIRPEHVRFYHDLVHGTMAYRERKGIRRPDMIELLSDARRGFLKYEEDRQRQFLLNGDGELGETGSEDVHGQQRRFWDADDVTAQCYVFFYAGAENSSTLLAFVAQELMENQAIQARLRAELDEVRERLPADQQTPSFDVLMSLPYLDAVVMETLRKWPSSIVLDRYCVQDCELRLSTGRTVQMRAGDGITIPVIGIHRDGSYHAEPERFDPERFALAERREQIAAFTYMPMGVGPRNCIGWRFAMMAVKAWLFRLLTEFELVAGERSQIPARTSAGGLLLRVRGGSWVKLRERRRSNNGD